MRSHARTNTVHMCDLRSRENRSRICVTIYVSTIKMAESDVTSSMSWMPTLTKNKMVNKTQMRDILKRKQ